jgi:hypothetical protein
MKVAFTNLFDSKLRAPLPLMLLVLLSSLVAPEALAQGGRHFPAMPSFDNGRSQNAPAGHAGNQMRTMHLDGTAKMKHEKMDPDRDKLTTIPHWTGKFSYHGWKAVLRDLQI